MVKVCINLVNENVQIKHLPCYNCDEIVDHGHDHETREIIYIRMNLFVRILQILIT